MAKRIIYFILIIVLLTGLTTAIIYYGRGWRFDPRNRVLNSTGILSVSSFPQKSSIYLDGKLVSATDASLSLPPDWYQVKISKVGYQPWEKRIRVQGEVVSQVDALLIPNNPSLKAVTNSGILFPTLSPGSTRVAYFVINQDTVSTTRTLTRNGIWVMDLRSGALGAKPEPKQIYQLNKNTIDFKAKLYWSYDEKEIIVTFLSSPPKKETVTQSLLLSVDSPIPTIQDVTLTYQDLLADWDLERKIKQDLSLSSLPPAVNVLLTQNSNRIHFSPDETKILYQATSSASLFPVITPPLIGANPTEEVRKIEPDNFYVYDLKEDKNFLLAKNKNDSLASDTPMWYTDSKHLFLVEKDSIVISDYDGTNKRSVYSGPFSDDLILPWASGGKIVIQTNLNKADALPNLYEIDLR